MKTRYVELIEPGRLAVREKTLTWNSRQMLVRTEACGICQYDAAYFKGLVGTPPQSLGHEPVGIVEEVGSDVTTFQPGDRVTGLFGFLESFATAIVANPGEAIKVPATVNPAEYLGEPAKCISTIVRAANPEFGDNVLVMGAGFMGLLTIAGLASPTLRTLIAVDLDRSRLERASRYGATHTVAGDDPNLLERVLELTDGRGIDVAVELTSNPIAVQTAARTLRRGGRPRYVLAGWHGAPGEYVLRTWTTVGAEIRCAHPRYSLDPIDDLRRGVEGIASGALPVGDTITHRFPLDDLDRAFALMASGEDGYVKGVVTF